MSSPTASTKEGHRAPWWGKPSRNAGVRYHLEFLVGLDDNRNQDLFCQLGDYAMMATHCLRMYATREEAESTLANLPHQDYHEYTTEDDENITQLIGCDRVRVYGTFCISEQPSKILK